MSRSSIVVIAVTACCIQIHAVASSLTCSSATGSSHVFTATTCVPLFSPTATLDWGSPAEGSITGAPGSNLGGLGPATLSEPAGTTLDAEVGGDPFTIVSNEQLKRVDNTALAWNGTNWAPANFVYPTYNFFAGNFGAPDTPTSQPPTGDNLLGALATSGSAEPMITLSFSLPLEYVGFEIGSANNINFTAQLLAFNAGGQQIGTYQIVDTGTGGACAGLADNPPIPCSDAPLIQFYDPAGTIASIEAVVTDDVSGLYIDTMQTATAPGAPEPGTLILTGLGCVAVVYLRHRRNVRWRRLSASIFRGEESRANVVG